MKPCWCWCVSFRYDRCAAVTIGIARPAQCAARHLGGRWERPCGVLRCCWTDRHHHLGNRQATEFVDQQCESRSPTLPQLSETAVTPEGRSSRCGEGRVRAARPRRVMSTPGSPPKPRILRGRSRRGWRQNGPQGCRGCGDEVGSRSRWPPRGRWYHCRRHQLRRGDASRWE